MTFLGKPFFHSYGYGAKQPVGKDDAKNMQMNPTLVMQSLTLKDKFLQKTKKKGARDGSRDKSANKNPVNNEFITKLLNEFPPKKSYLGDVKSSKTKQRNSVGKSLPIQYEYGVLSRQPSPTPHSRLPLLGNKAFSRVTSEEKKNMATSYLKRERLKRYLDSSNKMTWETMERLNKEDLKELTKADFDPSSLFHPQTEDERKYLIQLGVLSSKDIRPDRMNLLQVTEPISTASSKSPAMIHAINQAFSDGKKEKRSDSKKSFHKADTSPVKRSLQPVLPVTNTVFRESSAQKARGGSSQNMTSKSKAKGVSNERQRARQLSVESQAKRHQQLIHMLKNKIS